MICRQSLRFQFKMFKGKSSDFKTLVLLRIIKRLIENTESYGMYKLENILSNEIIIPTPIPKISKEELKIKREQAIITQKNKIKKEVKNKFKMMASPKIKESTSFISPATTPVEEKLRPSHSPQKNKPRFIDPLSMKVPGRQKLEYNNTLPEHLRYLRPTPILKRVGMDLGKLNPYLEDPNIDSIEVEGENEKIYVVGKMGKKPISLVLNRDEIDAIIDKFSSDAKIPKVEGLFKVSINNLILTAMVSSVISSRFIIKKIKI